MTQTPSLGRVVHFTVSQEDADKINKRREDFAKHYRKHPSIEPTGYVAHYGNQVRSGDVFAATIVRVFPTAINLQVLLDGNDTYWATSVPEGEGLHTWTWPPKV